MLDEVELDGEDVTELLSSDEVTSSLDDSFLGATLVQPTIVIKAMTDKIDNIFFFIVIFIIYLKIIIGLD